ncbi:MAG: ABC transporter permease [Bacteroidota bacterium]|nr:ABC transporter permease [Bacteroidota bacterium]MDP4215802.1 ABC transporter permease [Bacteroidota bacterium]MDP4245299.1 ABC transporter permease [Bacteroidota bacterium]MDP4253647.1 ABC transporter permease [Bacteroidota bacterium]MDP4256592.1 ABC transporter permease [Bacteroidota bacterium]
MSKIWLVTKREYLTRVRNKTFLLTTFLLPLMIVLFVIGAIFIAVSGKSHNRIAVSDANGYFKDYLRSDSTIAFDFSPDIDTLNYAEKGCTAALIIPVLREDQKTIYRLKYKKQLGFAGEEDLAGKMRTAITDHMIFEKTSLTRGRLDSIRSKSDIAELRTYEDRGKESKESKQGFLYLIGYVSGFLIYLLTFLYGAAVMRGVMEEKTNRIAEVIVCSVRPFELMMGKIVGIGAVGLTQFVLWVVLLGGLFLAALGFVPHDTWLEVQKLQQANAMGNASTAQASAAAEMVFNTTNAVGSANWGLLLSCFLFYFFGGYLFYSALFAAVGSAVNEDPQEAQSLLLPITMPVIFSFIIMTIAIQDPGGKLAVWASIIPFSSSIVMMARIPFGVPGTVPLWQLGLSMMFLILGFLFTVWLAGKIYRTGILMYGKKPTWKTMWKWAFTKS